MTPTLLPFLRGLWIKNLPYKSLSHFLPPILKEEDTKKECKKSPYNEQKRSNVKKSLIFVLPTLLFTLFAAAGQSRVKLHQKHLEINADTIVLDSNSLVLGSVRLQGIDKHDYTIDYLNGWLIIVNPALNGRMVATTFRSYPYKINAPALNKPLSIIEKRLYAPVNPLSIPESSSGFSDIFSDASLHTSGSLSRGISIGNAQDMAVNSNLNLQISGKLDENIEILANITDQNIPIQPEGNSAKLKDFDRIFIFLTYKKLITITAGDVIQKSQNTYFAKYAKQGMGLLADASFSTTASNNRTTAYKVYAGGSIAKGTFKSQPVTPIESVQGPYKLYGENHETFISVLAGSERVYINGVLLQRGEDADYVIDYNRSEITFTARQPVTKDKRILAEFEYSDQNYARALFTAGTEIRQKQWAASFHFYHEQDLKNQPNQLELTDRHRNFLASIGNRTAEAYMPSFDSSAFTQGEIRYKIIDTLVAGITYDSVFIYSTNSDSAFYRLHFTWVGEGKGDYILAHTLTNGRVFVWVAPVGGAAQGNYAPVRFVPAPKRMQMYTVSAEYLPLKNTRLSLETALSNHDLNTFSAHDDGRNVGFALKTALDNLTQLSKKDNIATNWQMKIHAYYETKNENFTYIEDYRNIEFARDYNLSDTLRLQSEHQFGAQLSFLRTDHGEIGIAGDAYIVPKFNYISSKSKFFTDFRAKRYHIVENLHILNNRQSEYKTFFLQNKTMLSKTFSPAEIGISNELEMNLYKTLSDSLLRQSFAANEISLFFRSHDSTSRKIQYGLHYTNRLDGRMIHDALSIASIAHEAGANVNILRNANHQLRFHTAYRYLSYRDSVGANTLLINTDYRGNFCKSALQLGVFYEIGSGLEQKNEYAYLRVTDGKGVYQWIDYNGNGIEEVDEFEVAVYADQAKYIRIWMPSDQYIKTLHNKFTASLNIKPSNIWRNSKGFKKFVSRFANLTVYQTQIKNTSKGFIAMLNPFYLSVADTALVLVNSSFRNAFSFNQSHSVFSAHAIYTHTVNKTLNTNGFEQTANSSWQFLARTNIQKMFTMQAEYQNAAKVRRYEYVPDKNYTINMHSIEGNIGFQHSRFFTINLIYQYRQKENRTGMERSVAHTASAEFHYSLVKRGSLYCRASYHHIHFVGEVLTSIAYEMLESLNPGHNGIFNLTFQTTLWQNLQLNISYEGRLAQKTTMQHLAAVELRAYF
jgi:hypothetical protein